MATRLWPAVHSTLLTAISRSEPYDVDGGILLLHAMDGNYERASRQRLNRTAAGVTKVNKARESSARRRFRPSREEVRSETRRRSTTSKPTASGLRRTGLPNPEHETLNAPFVAWLTSACGVTIPATASEIIGRPPARDVVDAQDPFWRRKQARTSDR